MNRRGFFTRISGLLAGAFALRFVKPSPQQFKSRMWFTSGGTSAHRYVFNMSQMRDYSTLTDAMSEARSGDVIHIARPEWKPITITHEDAK